MNKTGSREAVYLKAISSHLRHLPRRATYSSSSAISSAFGTNVEESYAAGEGAVVYDTLYLTLVERLCQRVYDLAEGLGKTCFITASDRERHPEEVQPRFDVITLKKRSLCHRINCHCQFGHLVHQSQPLTKRDSARPSWYKCPGHETRVRCPHTRKQEVLQAPQRKPINESIQSRIHCTHQPVSDA